MRDGQESQTALGAARHRAVHQILERGSIFADPLAVPILGANPASLVMEEDRADRTRRLRFFIAVRTRLAEDMAASAVARTVTQHVTLGAGLDTFACRSPHGDRLRCFEVDHPATQASKRERLAAAGIVTPPTLSFAPVDFERESLAEGLVSARFDPTQPAFFSWLGVVPYLTRSAVFATLRLIAGLGGEVVFDYGDPPEARSGEGQAANAALSARTEVVGEGLRTWFDPGELASELRSMGFRTAKDCGPAEIAARFFPHRPKPGRAGGHIIHAAA